MSNALDDLGWALYQLAYAGCYDEFSPGPNLRTTSNRGYTRATERFSKIAGDLK